MGFPTKKTDVFFNGAQPLAPLQVPPSEEKNLQNRPGLDNHGRWKLVEGCMTDAVSHGLKTSGWLGWFRGWNTTQLYRDLKKNIIRFLINQPVWWKVGRFFCWPWLRWFRRRDLFIIPQNVGLVTFTTFEFEITTWTHHQQKGTSRIARCVFV